MSNGRAWTKIALSSGIEVAGGPLWRPDPIEIAVHTRPPLIRDHADLLQQRLGAVVTAPELAGNPRGECAILRMRLDILDHPEFGALEIADQPARFIRRRMTVFGGLDRPASMFCLLAERSKLLHAAARRVSGGSRSARKRARRTGGNSGYEILWRSGSAA